MLDTMIRFAAVGLDHPHITGQLRGLLAAGAELVALATEDEQSPAAQTVRQAYPDVPFRAAAEVLADDTIELVVTAAVPDQRADIAVAALGSGKHVVTDKPGCTTLDHLDQIRRAVAQSGCLWSITFSERYAVPAVTRAAELVGAGRIGQVVQTIGLGPHREGDRAHLSGGQGRPEWFYDAGRSGGILADLATHQIDQFLWFTGSQTAEVVTSQVANHAHPDTPAMQDFGDMVLRSDHATGYVRVDWFTPQGLPTWGDGRTLLLGTEGYIELRKYLDVAGREGANHLIIVDNEGVHHEQCQGKPFDYYASIVADVRDNARRAGSQDHAFEVMRLALTAQEQATIIANPPEVPAGP